MQAQANWEKMGEDIHIRCDAHVREDESMKSVRLIEE